MTICIALGGVRLGCSILGIETHSMKLSTHHYWANLRTTRSLTFRRKNLVTCLNILRPHSFMRSTGFWPRYCHSLLVPLCYTSCYSDEIAWLDILHWWHPITLPRCNLPSPWESAILLQMFVEAVRMPSCWILFTCGCNPWIQWFEGVSEYFWQNRLAVKPMDLHVRAKKTQLD